MSQHVDFTSHALDEVRRFYAEVLGFAGTHADPGLGHVFVPTGPGSSIGFVPPRPVPPEQWRPPREPALCFVVDDVDRLHRDLVARGVEFEQAPEDTASGHRVAVLRDPEGRAICLAHVTRRA